MSLKNFFKIFDRSEKATTELEDIRQIILSVPEKLISLGQYTALMKEGDSVFTDRLQKNSNALTMNFWSTHFELDSFAAYPEMRGQILDFGCGSGHLDVFFARKGFHITGVDVSPVAIAISNYIRNKENQEVKDRLEFLQLDVTEPYTGKKFDSVWSTQVFEHLPNPAPLINGLRQFAKPGAPFLICVPYQDAYDDPGHCNHFYSEDELASFLQNCILVERVDCDIKKRVLRALCRF